jgi:hypothetical protein
MEYYGKVEHTAQSLTQATSVVYTPCSSLVKAATCFLSLQEKILASFWTVDTADSSKLLQGPSPATVA